MRVCVCARRIMSVVTSPDWSTNRLEFLRKCKLMNERTEIDYLTKELTPITSYEKPDRHIKQATRLHELGLWRSYFNEAKGPT